MKPRTQGIANP
jgi:hypothetical protein